MITLFPELCRRNDAGNFYIACAMGLHRTDIALCAYWVFYGADQGLQPPQIHGYRQEEGHRIDKIMRVLNALYQAFTHLNGIEPLAESLFKERKAVITRQTQS